MRLTLLIALVFALPAAAGTRQIALDDYFRWQTVSDPRVSPDGKWIAYSLATPDRESDADRSSIWLASWNGKSLERLTPASIDARGPRWSHDGRYLGFLSDQGDENGSPQIWAIDRTTGDAVQRSRFNGSIADFTWSPDGTRIAFSGIRAAPANASAGGKPAPIVIDRLQFKRDFVGFLGTERSHIYLLELASGALAQITNGPGDEIQPAWSADGSRVIFLTKAGPEPDRHDNWDLYDVAPRTDTTPRQLTDTPEMENDPEWGRGYGPARPSPDGERLAYVRGGRPEDSWFGLVQLAVSAANGSDARLTTLGLDRLSLDPKWSRSGQAIFFMLEDDRSQFLARLRLADGRIDRLTPADSVVSEFDVGGKDHIAVAFARSDQPSELFALDSGKLRPLTHHNDAWSREVSMVRARNMEYKSADGTSVHGLLFLPPGEKPKSGWPALVQVDGGPVYQWQHEFEFDWQYLVGQGYAVLAPNPRGSSGRGFDYQRAIFANWGFVDGPDVVAAVDYAVAEGLIDPDRLGIGGWSYGAQLTNFILATDSRFKAATSGAGISNMLAGYGVDQYVREWETELGLPWKNTELWLRLSYAFLHADRIVTPTLFLGGTEDANVPAVGAQQMYEALRRVGVPTELVLYPGEFHSFARPGFRIDVLRRYLEWYDRYLKSDVQQP